MGSAIFGDTMAPPPPPRKSPEPLFPKLSGRSARAMGSAKVARHQRGRLIGAMVQAIAREGYEGVTVGQLVALAGVSKTAFYESFAGKEECFWATFDEIVEQGADQIAQAYRSRHGFPERLEAAFEAFVDIVAGQPEAARLVIVESVSLGAASVAPRERAAAVFEAMVHQSFEEAPAPGEVSPLTARAIVGGIREIVYRYLRQGNPEQLRDHTQELLDWGLGYRHTGARRSGSVGAKLVEAAAASGVTPERPKSLNDKAPEWEEAANSPRSRAALSPRERIMRGAAQVAVENGYGALSVSAISAAAGTSNQTFYEHFAGKEQAFVAAFDILAQRAFEVTAVAFGAQESWLEAGAAGVTALLEFFAADRLFRQLVFFELPAAGPAALDRAEAMLRVFTVFLQPDPLPPEVEVRPPKVVVEAIAGGIWAVVQHEIVAGRIESLPQMAPKILDIALMPFGIG